MSTLVKTKKKNKFFEGVKRAGRGTGKAVSAAALNTKEYFVGVKDAYDMGYKSGFEDGYRIPKKVGSQLSAVSGYKVGLGSHLKAQKAFAKYHKRKKKSQIRKNRLKARKS